MQRSLIATVFCLGLAPAVQAAEAPLVDVYAGGYGWDAQPSGTFSSTRTGDTDVDIEDDLDFDKNRNNIFYIGVEHPVPLLPNVRLRSADISDSARSTLNRNFIYEGQPYAIGTDVESRYQLDYTEATLYYTPLDTVAQVDIGLTARKYDAVFEVESVNTPQRSAVEADATLPMLHAGVKAELPLTGFYVDGQLDAVSYDGNSVTDARAALGWRSNFALGLELGYQQMNVKLDETDDLNADIEFGGPFLALSVAI